jgi:hypothetical protein
MSDRATEQSEQNSIVLAREGDGWVVIVTEDGEQFTRSFASKGYAKNFAAGQRIRLRLPPEDYA